MTDEFHITREHNAELDALLGNPFKVLDKGFIRLIDYMGSDSAIVQAARVSYGKGTKRLNEDRGLIRYLMRHRHTTPFEMCEIKFHVKLPIFVARQWVRHRTANINEYSARYSVLDNEFYVPEPAQLGVQHQHKKQARGAQLETQKHDEIISVIEKNNEDSYKNYEWMIDEMGLAREVARTSLPVNIYTQWYWKINLHNLLHFISLRKDPHAQYEIRVYADILADIVQKWVPLTYEAFSDYVLGGAKLSANGLALVKARLRGDTAQEAMIKEKISAGELRELEQLLDLENE
ncbi:MAG: FAD-dependent thymidylate synthase [Alphaproteobacteria bacterium]|nr:FAD-dependent thymidylate synthase [Alphaproteobacteria bacterium]